MPTIMEDNVIVLSGQIQSAPSGVLGFDTDTQLNSGTAQQFYNGGYRFCARYLSLATGQAPGDLSADEARAIFDAGLALLAVQHVRAAGWQPNASLGTTDGTNAAKNAKSIGLPEGMNVWCDLEGISNTASAQDVIDYCNAWYAAVSIGGYVPGLYVGANAILSGDQLYSDLKFQHYWKSASTVPEVAVRGYQLIQSDPNITVNGIGIDKDTTQTDNKGGQVQWLVA